MNLERTSSLPRRWTVIQFTWERFEKLNPDWNWKCVFVIANEISWTCLELIKGCIGKLFKDLQTQGHVCPHTIHTLTVCMHYSDSVSIFTHFARPVTMNRGWDAARGRGGELNQKKIARLNCKKKNMGQEMVFWRNNCLIWCVHVHKHNLQKTDKDPGLLISHLINKGYLCTTLTVCLIHCTNPLQPSVCIHLYAVKLC